jgi:hypothetical protein
MIYVYVRRVHTAFYVTEEKLQSVFRLSEKNTAFKIFSHFKLVRLVVPCRFYFKAVQYSSFCCNSIRSPIC